MNMKCILVGLVLMTLLGACSANQSITMRDNEYFSKITTIMKELDSSFNEVTPKFQDYINDTTKYKELNAPAEKAYTKIHEIRKRIEKVKPIDDDWKATQNMLIYGLECFEDSMKYMIRLSNTGNEDLKDDVAVSANRASMNLKVLDNFKEQLPK